MKIDTIFRGLDLRAGTSLVSKTTPDMSLASVPDPERGSLQALRPAAESPLPLGRASLALPSMWIGYALAASCFALTIGQFATFIGAKQTSSGVPLLYLCGLIYWFYCVHRIHRVLRDATESSYPISPRRAVGFMLIPIYSVIWMFKWPRSIGKFVNARAGSNRMSLVCPSLLLLAADLMSFLPGLRLLLLFSVGTYITRRLRTVLPVYSVRGCRRKEQVNLAVSAGLAAGFAFVLCQAVLEFLQQPRAEQIHGLITIGLVSVGVIKFLEPIFERIRIGLGMEDHHPAMQGQRSWLLRLGGVLLIAATSLCHGILHKNIDSHATESLQYIVTALFISGGITYIWISGARSHPARAASWGLSGGACLGIYVVIAFCLTGGPAAHPLDPAAANPKEVLEASILPLIPSGFIPRIASGDLTSDALEMNLLPAALPWAFFGLIGGMAIDKRWGTHRSRGVAVCLLAAASLIIALIWFAGGFKRPDEALADVCAVAGWAAALLISPVSDRLLEISGIGIIRMPPALRIKIHGSGERYS